VRCAAVLLGAFFCGLSCAGTRAQDPDPGSETNFLSRCDSDAACGGGGLSCLCGACTRTCGDATACDSLSSGAACVPVTLRPEDPSCPGSAVTAFCDALCADDAGCAALGASYRCDRGYCRALNASCATGQTTGGEVVLLGDTFISDTHELTGALEELARDSGALSADDDYRDHASALQANLAVDPPGVAVQYATALEEGPVKVVVMAAGGADVLMGRCPDPIAPNCPLVADAVAGAELLFQRMAADGVEHVVFFFYPDYVGDARIKATIDVLRPLLEERCARAPLPCHWLDLRPTFAGNYDEYILPDGRNPTTAGAEASAEAIWSLMQQRCVAQ
jgi:hypothetical protein